MSVKFRCTCRKTLILQSIDPGEPFDCPACGASHVAPQTEPSRKGTRPHVVIGSILRDPIGLFGLVAPFVIVAVLFAFLYADGREKEFARQVVALGAEARAIEAAGHREEAVAKYEELLGFVGTRELQGLEAQEEVSHAAASRPVLVSSIERDRRAALFAAQEVQLKAEQERAARLALETPAAPAAPELVPAAVPVASNEPPPPSVVSPFVPDTGRSTPAAPGYYDSDKTVSVRGYYRKDGTYVRPHMRRPPRR